MSRKIVTRTAMGTAEECLSLMTRQSASTAQRLTGSRVS
jgi:hypothetical protein